MKVLYNRDLEARFNCSDTKVWRLRKDDPDFPAPGYIGSRPFWTEQQIDDYIAIKMSQREPVAA
jgi:predicted DNA-binding transcriptional regulator AlpA